MLMLLSNPIFTAYKGSDWFGKAIFLALLFLSIVTWVIFIKKINTYRDARQKGILFFNAFKKRMHNPLALEIGLVTHPYASIYRTLKHHVENQRLHSQLSTQDYTLISAALTTTVTKEIKFLNKNIFILSTITSLAPFLGLLGTVWGILLTFGELQNHSSSSANATIMGGLAMALGTTVVGLLVAIPSLISYNYLKSVLSHFTLELEDFGTYCLACVKLYDQKTS